MKKLTIGIALFVATLATVGQLRHPSNPLIVNGTRLRTTPRDWPPPHCPPSCPPKVPQ
jgi:hypothetical protein